MMPRAHTDPGCEHCQHTKEILESWMEIFLDYCKHGSTYDLFATRPPDEVPIILKAMFRHFWELALEQKLKDKSEQTAIGTLRQIMELAAREISVLPNERAWKQIKTRVLEQYAQMSEKGVDTQSQEKEIVEYLHCYDGLWKQAQVVPAYRDLEDSREEELFNKLRNLTAIK